MLVECAYCGAEVEKTAGSVNRARKHSNNIYCNRKCAGLSRRKGKTKEQKVAEKREYDKAYRARNAGRLKDQKAKWHKRTYDPDKARVERKKKMDRHVEYCRRPEYKKWKADYDRKYRAKKNFGEFHECFLLLLDIDDEVSRRMSRYDVYSANGTLNKRLKRRREHERSFSSQP